MTLNTESNEMVGRIRATLAIMCVFSLLRT